jgi:hypothetical protein
MQFPDIYCLISSNYLGPTPQQQPHNHLLNGEFKVSRRSGASWFNSKEITKMTVQAKAVLLFSCLLLTLAAVACEKEGGAERAGKQIDKALDRAKDKIHDATK